MLPVLGVLAVFALLLVALIIYTAAELRRFERVEARRGTLVYSGGQWVGPGVNLRVIDLTQSLGRLRYSETRGRPRTPGQYQRRPDGWEIVLRMKAEGRREPQHVRLETRDDRITGVLVDGQPVPGTTLEPEVLTSIDDRAGEEFRPVKLAEVPITLLSAILAAEDHRFFEHGGLDLRGVVRAAWVNFRAGRVTQGGSTITQQLVKNRLLSARRSYARKLREAWLAALVEWRYPKERILEAYLNEIYLGQHGPLAVRGVGAAARAYFGKEVHQLSLGEAALIAGMARAPNTYSPFSNRERARERRDVILTRMLELGKIVEAEYAAARREPVRARRIGIPGQSAPYFADRVRQEVEDVLGGDAVGRAGRIFTTLDPSLQQYAESAVSRGLERLEARSARLRRSAPAERLQAALVVLDPTTGAIRALVGGRDYLVSQYNRAVLARRQPGSAFKPFVYAAALAGRNGHPAFTAASLVDDTPITLGSGDKSWSPRNYDDRYEGRVSVRRALELSLNAATVRIAMEIGLPEVIQTAQRLGLTAELAPVPAMALGAFEVTPLGLAQAYLPFVNGGTRLATVSTIRAVVDGDGTDVMPAREPPAAVMSPAEAYLMTSLLAGVVTSGTAASARSLGVTGEVAGKTGTTNDERDSWFVGYSPGLLALVWVGFDDNTPVGLSGAQAALPIWADLMRQVAAAYGTSSFVVPAGITTAQIDPTTGKLATRYCPTVAPETFLTGTEPSPCPEHQGMTIPDQMTDWWRRFRDWLKR
jgi:penicillin-binding protein 1B